MYAIGRETLKNITLKRENLKAIAIRRESIKVMVVRREKLKTIFATRENVSKVCKCTVNANHESSNQFSVIKYIFYGTAGFLGYKLYKDNSILKTVEAAVPVKKSLSGRRNQFNFIADVVEQSASSVVYIEIKDMRRLDFFTGRPATASNGSGFIIKEDGLIVTNAHVVVNKPNSKVEVRLQDGATYTGIVEDVDLNSDLALVRIQCKNLPVMKLGKSDDMRPGEFVVAIGSPLSLSNTVTAGVISSVHRGSEELGLRGKEMVYIQTDAAITFGNSGGPLVNLDGEAVGVNSMKVTAGISFAIPIDYVKSFLAQSKGAAKPTSLTPSRRYMGITMLSLTPQILKELQERQHPIPTDVTFGILVWKVIIGSPAHSGGLQPGDIVTHINGNAVKHVNDIYTILGETKNRVLKMTVVRLGQRMEVAVTPEDTM